MGSLLEGSCIIDDGGSGTAIGRGPRPGHRPSRGPGDTGHGSGPSDGTSGGPGSGRRPSHGHVQADHHRRPSNP